MTILKRFLKYVSISTTSNSKSETTPSTKEQFEFAKLLYTELSELGLDRIYFDREHCYLYGYLKGNSITSTSIGFIAHMDTSEDAKGDNIKPRIIENYDGKDIKLNNDKTLEVKSNPDLLKHIGKTLITTDGNTLLGGDDKAGIVEIMTMLEHFKNTNDPHGDIYVAFTPDEELGKGTKYFNFYQFKPDFAYTVDGEYLGEFSYENFNAATVNIRIKGNDIHPGYAKDKMINALLLANAITNSLPNETPSNTELREGFYHLMKLNGNVSNAEIKYIIRDHDKEKFEMRKQFIKEVVDNLNLLYNNCISINIKDTYYNMYEKIKDRNEIIENTKDTIKSLGIEPIIKPIRGGTDGANLSHMGLPCPNLGTGAHNFHSVYEYAVLEDMIKTSEILINIAKSYVKENTKAEKIYQKS
ncbi:MAG: peptidase T [Bacilli bacterium]|nr:peptidase T [Bacilli bacterium]